MEDINLIYKLECVDSFISMHLKRLNAIEYIIKIKLTRDYCTQNHNTLDISFTICRQVNE